MEFITGNKFKGLCNFYLDETGFKYINKSLGITKFFVKTDLIDLFFNEFKPNYDFILITHNSDIKISERHRVYLDEYNLKHWYAQNVDVIHDKLSSIPIGIANEIWSHGDETVFNNVLETNNDKNNLVYANFDVNTNIIERYKCLKSLHNNGLQLDDRCSLYDYLTKLSKSYFVISPNGNGIDCHKTWESLYFKSIPIVTKSINIEKYCNLPILIINDWDSFDVNSLSVELYDKIMKENDSNIINMSYYRKLLN